MTTTTFSGTQSAQGSVITNNNQDVLYFIENSRAGNAVVTNHAGGTTSFSDHSSGGQAQIDNSGGTTYFSESATADHSTITVSAGGIVDFSATSTAANAAISNGSNGTTYFEESSGAGSATIDNYNGGSTFFSDSTTAGGSTITTGTNGLVDFAGTSTAATATIKNSRGGTTYFEESSSAGSAVINNTAGATYLLGTSTAANSVVVNTGEGFIDFLDSATAGNATILNDGSALPPSGSGSYTDFENTSTAGNSTITSINGGRVVFYDQSNGGSARLITEGSTSSVEFSLTTGAAGDRKVSAGSISGSGTIYLGASALTVGSLGLNDTVSGLIRDGGRGGGTGASLVKVGSGTLTLSGNNAYTGGTTLVAGTLDLASLSAAGSGALSFTSGAQTLAIEAAALNTNAQHGFGNTITGFTTDGDIINVRGIGSATASFDDVTDLLTLSVGGQTAATLTISGSFAGQQFQTVSDGQGGTNVSVGAYTPPTYAIAVTPGSGPEGDIAGQGSVFTYTVTRTGSLGAAGSVAVGFGGTAAPDTDYTVAGLTNGTVSFAAGASTATFTVTTTPDTVVEGDETVTATLGAVTGGGTPGTNSTATATILNDDTPPVYAIALTPATGTEGDVPGQGSVFTYTVTRTGSLDAAGSVAVGFSGTATPDADYTVAGLTNGAVSFDAGVSTATFTVTTTPDTVVEGDETVVASLGAITGGGTLGTNSTATATILDDDTAPTYSIGVTPGSGLEGDIAGQGRVFTYTVTRTGSLGASGSVAVGLDGTATLDTDYTVAGLTNGAVSFDAGVSTATFTVTTTPDAIVEGDETVIATLGAITGGGTLGTNNAATATILNDDTAPTYSIGVTPGSGLEGDVAGQGSVFTYTVTRTGSLGAAGSVAVGLSGTAALDSDYAVAGLTNGAVSFDAGASTATFTVTTTPDTVVDGDETVVASLGAITGGGTLGTNSTATATIVDDDTPPTYSIAVTPGSGPEGDAAGQGSVFTYTVTRTGSLGTAGSVAVGLSGTAAPDTDYTVAGLTNGAVTFDTGASTATFTVTTTPDTVVESDETVIATLGGITGGGTLGSNSTATATIANDDIAPTYSIAVNPGSGPEGDVVGQGSVFTYTVTRTGSLDAAGSVAVGFSGTATPDADYAVAGLTNGAVSFDAGVSTATFTVTTTPDTIVEPDETVVATLGAITGGGALGANSTAAATILNDDIAPTYSIAVTPGAGPEGDVAGQGSVFTYTVSRTGSLWAGSVAVGFSGTATNNTDYTVAGLTNGAVSFAAGASSATFTVTTTPDTIVESDETVIATLGAITGGGALGTNSAATVTIANDDTPPTYSIAVNPGSGPEGDVAGQGSVFTYTVTRTGSLGAAGGVAVGLSGTATNTSDYTVAGLTNGAVSFAAGAATATFTVTSKPDTVVEGDETVIATLGPVTGGGTVGANNAATATILNDDVPPTYSIAVNPGSGAEGDVAGQGTVFTYTVSRTGSLWAGSVAVGFSGTATNTTDYTVAGLTSGKVNFAAGASTATFTVTTKPDTIVEGDETVTATLGAITGGGALSANKAATATILNDDIAPTYSIAVNPGSGAEGDTAGQGSVFTYTVSRTGSLWAGSVAVGFSGTATNTTDYTVAGLSSGKVNFAAGASTATFTVTTKPDAVVEGDETVTATLGAITGGGTLGANIAATATILNDDTAPTYSIAVNPGSGAEGDVAGQGSVFTYTVSRTGSLGAGSVAVGFSGTATNNTDYTVAGLTSGKVNFAAGASTATFTVTTKPDMIVEPDETVIATLGAIAGGGTLGTNSTATATILNDDTAPTYSIAVNPGSGLEGDTAGQGSVFTYTVSRTGSLAAGSVAVGFSGTATSNTDYTVAGLTSGKVNFAAGASTATFTVTSKPDTVVEGDETVTATLGAITGGGTLGANSAATATIVNDDTAPTYSIAVTPGSGAEGNNILGQGTVFTYTVSRTGSLGVGSVAVGFSGTATNVIDYTVAGLSSGKVNFAAGASTATFTVTTRPDTVVEPDETVTATLGAITGGGALGANKASTATILNDDTLRLLFLARAPIADVAVDSIQIAATDQTAASQSAGQQNSATSLLFGGQTVQSFVTGTGLPGATQLDAMQGDRTFQNGAILTGGSRTAAAPKSGTGPFAFDGAFGRQTVQDFITGAGSLQDMPMPSIRLPEDNDFAAGLSGEGSHSPLGGIGGSTALKGGFAAAEFNLV